MSVYTLNNFTQGELSKRLIARKEMEQYKNGVQELTNWTILPHGGVERRPGTQFVADIQQDADIKFIPFRYSKNESYVVVFYDKTARFFTQGGGIVGAPYTISTDFSKDELEGLKWAQIKDTLFLVHPNHGLYRLEFRGHTDWNLVKADLEEGPYLPVNTDNNWELTPTDNDDGTAKISANKDTFESGNEGGLFRLKHSRTNNELHSSFDGTYPTLKFTSGSVEPDVGDQLTGQSSNADGLVQSVSVDAGTWTGGDAEGEISLEVYSGTFQNEDVDNTTDGGTNVMTLDISDRYYTSDIVAGEGEWKAITHNSWTGTLILQRKFEGETVWQDYRTYSSNQDNNVIDTGTQEDVAEFRFKLSDYDLNTDKVEYLFSLYDHYHETVIRIDSVTDAQNATGTLINVDSLNSTDIDGYSTTVWAEGAWSVRRGFPIDITLYQQRLVLAGTDHEPSKIWASRIDDFTDFELGTNDNDPFAFSVFSEKREKINWIQMKRHLIVGTSGGIWSMGGGNNLEEPITPTNVQTRKSFDQGSSIVVSWSNRFFITPWRSDMLIEMYYDAASYKYETNDMTILSPHIGDKKFYEMDWSGSPYRSLWTIMENGELYSFIREPEHEIAGWARQKIGDAEAIEHVAVTEGEYGDEIWLYVKRNINGSDKYYIEIIQPSHWEKVEDAKYLDSSLSYDSTTPADTFGNLGHLEGEKVTALADGKEYNDLTVSGGKVTLPVEASVVAIGKLYSSYNRIMPVAFTPDIHGRIPELIVEVQQAKNGEVIINDNKSKAQKIDTGKDLLDGYDTIQLPSGLKQRIDVGINVETAYPFRLLALHIRNVLWGNAEE